MQNINYHLEVSDTIVNPNTFEPHKKIYLKMNDLTSLELLDINLERFQDTAALMGRKKLEEELIKVLKLREEVIRDPKITEEANQVVDRLLKEQYAKEKSDAIDEYEPPARTNSFEKDLESLINCYSLENGSDTPDFILAKYLKGCLDNWNEIMTQREAWYGRRINPINTTIELKGGINNND